jgi:hypothetical protein
MDRRRSRPTASRRTLADAIADERRNVAPAAVALCRTLLCDGASSPLYNTILPEHELDRALAVVEAGIAAPTPAHADRRQAHRVCTADRRRSPRRVRGNARKLDR